MIEIRGLKKSFGAQRVLDGVDLFIERGGTTAVVGPSGTGKSVLLKIVVGLLDADSGEVLVDGQSMTSAGSAAERRKITARMGVLFQNAALFDSLNVFDNVAFPLRERLHLSYKEVVRRSLEAIEKVGLGGQETALPGEISIGMRKRVGIARALVTEPDVILFDEPNTGLDPEMGQEIYELIQETQKLCGFTGIVISHEIPEVFQVCSRVAMHFDGKIRLEGSPTEFLGSSLAVAKQFAGGEIEGPIQMV